MPPGRRGAAVLKLYRRLRRRYRQVWTIVGDTARGVFADGFVHAGNLAYLSLLTLFPFFIVIAAIAGSFGRTEDGLRAVHAFMETLPPAVAALIGKPITDVLTARSTGGLLTFGILVTLWTVSGFMETIRDIIRRAYGVTGTGSLWKYRIGSIAVVIGAVVLMLVAFTVQVVLTGAREFVDALFPLADEVVGWLGVGRLVPAVLLFLALYLIFYVLTPQRFRRTDNPIWPGALVTTMVWIGTTMLLPVVLGRFGRYDLTYGSLAGVIVALLFFWIIGLGMVIGAQLNAALAKARASRLKALGQDVSVAG